MMLKGKAERLEKKQNSAKIDMEKCNRFLIILEQYFERNQ